MSVKRVRSLPLFPSVKEASSQAQGSYTQEEAARIRRPSERPDMEVDGTSSRPNTNKRSYVRPPVCTYYMEGRCNRNPCNFLHPDDPSAVASHTGSYNGKRSNFTPDDSSFQGGSTRRNVWGRLRGSKAGKVSAFGEARHGKARDKLCHFFLRGNCNKGDQCNYVHSYTNSDDISFMTQLSGHEKAVRAIALPAGSNKLYTGGQDGTIRVWDCDTGQVIMDAYNKKITVQSRGKTHILDVKLKGESIFIVLAFTITSVMKERSMFLQQFSDCFFDSLPSQSPPERPEDRAIDLVPGSSPPTRPPYRIVHVEGKKNVVADALSRKPQISDLSIPYHHELDDMKDEYANDEDFARIFEQSMDRQRHEHYFLKDGFMLMHGRARLKKGKERLFPKLNMRYYGLFQVCDKINDVAYRLKLPENWKIHNAFHVSLLRAYVGDVPEDMPTEEQLEVEELDEILVPEQTLAHKERKVKGKVARRYLVKFRNYPPMDAK
ncbi:hypothetical protein L7F22_062427 [Adiantum nelumboides]|nr:hypothetical protein [Adiantum nelumboides]